MLESTMLKATEHIIHFHTNQLQLKVICFTIGGFPEFFMGKFLLIDGSADFSLRSGSLIYWV